MQIFLRNFAHFSVKNFALCKKNHVFLRKILQKNIQCKNCREKLRKKLRKNKLKTFQSYTSATDLPAQPTAEWQRQRFYHHVHLVPTSGTAPRHFLEVLNKSKLLKQLKSWPMHTVTLMSGKSQPMPAQFVEMRSLQSLVVQGDPKKMYDSVLKLKSGPEVRFYFPACVLDSEFLAWSILQL